MTLNRSSLILAGLGIQILFCLLCARHAGSIEDRLKLTARGVLSATDMSWVRVEMDGRDMTLRGIAPTAALAETAAARMQNIRGIRRLENRLEVAPADRPPRTTAGSALAPPPVGDAAPARPGAAIVGDMRPYEIVFRRQGGVTTLEGLVPDETSRDTLITLAGQQFGDLNLIDRLEVRPGAPEEWMYAATIALGLTDALADGQAGVRGSTLYVQGLATSQSAVDGAREAMATQVPDGYFGTVSLGVENDLNTLTRMTPGLSDRVREHRERAPPPVVVPRRSEPVAAPTRVSGAECQSLFNEILAGERILFATASVAIKPASYPVLDRLVAAAKRCPGTRFEIAGHTDDQGTETNNLALSQRRAESVMQYLVKAGVSLNRLEARGYGESRPLVENLTAEHRARNRRIELTILNGNQP